MKTTLDLPDDLIRAVKLRAVAQNRTLKDLVTEFLQRGLGMHSSEYPEQLLTSLRVEIGENGLPFIQCRLQAPATRMRVEELLLLEQQTQTEEDLKRVGVPL